MTQRQADSERQNKTKYLKGKLTEIELGDMEKVCKKTMHQTGNGNTTEEDEYKWL